MATVMMGQEANELLATITGRYQELARLTAAFLHELEAGAPGETAQAEFSRARATLIEELAPMLARQQQWLGHGQEGQHRQECQGALANQLRYLEEIAALDGQLLPRLVALRSETGEELAAIRRGREGLAGYRVGLKARPRFCRRTA